MWHNSAAPDAFAKGHEPHWTMRCWASLILFECYSLVCLYGLGHGLRINAFKPTWLYLIVKVLATWVKFLEPSGYCTMINSVFPFCTTNIFGCFHDVLVQFELLKKFPNKTVAHSAVWLSNHWTTYQCTNYHEQWVLSTAWTALVRWCTHCKLACTKILQNFLFILVVKLNKNICRISEHCIRTV